MKQISILTIGFAVALAFAPALAEDFTAGKTPAQLFRSDCATCHPSPNGLVRRRGNVGELTDFLREHYTTKSETAAALAAYVSGFAPTHGTGHSRTRNHSEIETTVTADHIPADPASADAPAPRRRHAGDINRPRAHDDGDTPRPPHGIANRSADPEAASMQQATKPAAPKLHKHRHVTDKGRTGSRGGEPAEASPPEPHATTVTAPEGSPAAGGPH